MNMKRRKTPRRKLRRSQKKRVRVTLWLILSLRPRRKLNQRKLNRMDLKETLADSLDQMLLRPRNGLVLCQSDTRPISMDLQRT